MAYGAYPDLIVNDAQTGTGAGLAVGIGGTAMRYANSSSSLNSNRYSITFKVRVILKDSTTGATATVAVQESDDNSSYTTLYSFSMVIGSADPNMDDQDYAFKSNKRYVRTNVTAITGGSAPAVDSYLTLGTIGV